MTVRGKVQSIRTTSPIPVSARARRRIDWTKPQPVIPTDASRTLDLLANQQFDLTYIDPPYDTPFHLTPVAPLLALNGILFLEERHNPKKQRAPIELPRLHLKDARRFGSAILSTYTT